ncbi:hypothetical protein GOP47_0024973 [Adiantum capillus-veneris]|uniref:Uncharacterized protein n=1 Tax=Adiantum capillus-veneris TaxID=13818 RepID=A0A9D4U332_ADICA|nr:hypothetical protein GOP47_0024973 [Adiantum capillus-veneris]
MFSACCHIVAVESSVGASRLQVTAGCTFLAFDEVCVLLTKAVLLDNSLPFTKVFKSKAWINLNRLAT